MLVWPTAERRAMAHELPTFAPDSVALTLAITPVVAPASHSSIELAVCDFCLRSVYPLGAVNVGLFAAANASTTIPACAVTVILGEACDVPDAFCAVAVASVGKN